MLCVALGIERVLAVFSCIILHKYHDVTILLLSFKGDINGDFLPPTWKNVNFMSKCIIICLLI